MTGGDTCEHTITEAAAASGMSSDTLRYYERVGAIPPVERNASGQRRYSDRDLAWLGFVRRLRATGMSMQQVIEYVALAQLGERTVDARTRMLTTHRVRVVAAIGELLDVVRLLDRKIAIYGGAEPSELADQSYEPLQHTPLLS